MQASELHPRPTSDTTVALLMVAACALLILAIAHHPVAHGATAAQRLSSIAHQAVADEVVHGTILGLLLVLASGMGYYSLQRGIRKPAVLTACLAYFFATALAFFAAALDGFVTPALVEGCSALTEDCVHSAQELLRFASVCIQVFTRLSLFAMAAATLLWSTDLLIRGAPRWLGAVGVGIVLLQVWLLAGIARVLTPHSLLAVMVAEIAWYLIVAGQVYGRPGQAAHLVTRP